MTTPDCCAPTTPVAVTTCPACGTTGRAVKLVTLKALLTPAALAVLDPSEAHRFCPDAACDVVYFSASRTYRQAEVKVPVLQKDGRGTTPVCYCFGHTRADLEHAAREGRAGVIPQSVQAHIQAGRCGCEVNNPQGSCCLGNVNRTLAALQTPAEKGRTGCC
ncbi:MULTISPECIES: putative iron-sulfur cluster-binding metallochaperone [Deinococcus]|uniref:putative iron-sulfur cluster-binding metallochaperone n=1 Tax=Deinococcus TaxID=1298 RepID=UPI0005565372|nr:MULTISPECIES: copper chaperone Copz family protein [Deinococcus]MBI0445557.1 (2Fe-2S)-binding protein [Deinococcus sp. DB0503]